VLVLGPGQLLLSVLNEVSHTARDALEIAAGIAMIAAAVSLWHQRGRLAQKELPNPNPRRKSSLALGATMIAVELPTAFPYFAAIAAVLGSGGALPRQMLLIAVYNLCFVLPLVAILVTLLAFGTNADHILTRGRQALEQRWPAVFAGLLLAGGIVLGVVGGVELTGA
jgi:cytochrome c biogenesis protein CcdA